MKKNVTTKLFLSDPKEFEICGNKGYSFRKESFTKPYEIITLEYEEHNLNTCEACRDTHIRLTEEAKEKLEKFPHCCEHHKKLLHADWFNYNDFINTPKMYADKVIYSWHHILNFIGTDNWEIEIVDYLEHVIESFGDFPSKYGEPLLLSFYKNELTSFVNTLNDHPERKNMIINILSSKKPPTTKTTTNINVLIATYNNWYKTFPFELSYFSELKAIYSKKLPFFDKLSTNKYTKSTKLFPVSQTKLFENLITITNKILIEINTQTLIEKNIELDLDYIQLELTTQKRKQKLKEGYISKAKDKDTRYRKILKEWLKDEISFIKEIKPLLTKPSLFSDLLRCCHVMQQNNHFWNVDEDRRTKQILDLMDIKYNTKDQPKSGESSTGLSPGSIDGIITHNQIDYIIEALNLDYLNKKYITSHINKLEKNYDARGLKYKFLIIYYNVKDGTFDEVTQNYIKYISNEHEFIYPKTKELVEINSNYTNTKTIKTTHNREGIDVNIYHIMLKFPSKK